MMQSMSKVQHLLKRITRSRLEKPLKHLLSTRMSLCHRKQGIYLMLSRSNRNQSKQVVWQQRLQIYGNKRTNICKYTQSSRTSKARVGLPSKSLKVDTKEISNKTQIPNSCPLIREKRISTVNLSIQPSKWSSRLMRSMEHRRALDNSRKIIHLSNNS